MHHFYAFGQVFNSHTGRGGLNNVLKSWAPSLLEGIIFMEALNRENAREDAAEEKMLGGLARALVFAARELHEKGFRVFDGELLSSEQCAKPQLSGDAGKTRPD